MRIALPTLTRSCARGADPIGAFGLVGRGITIPYHGLACAGRRFLVGLDPVTNPYHVSNLALGLPHVAFTKHHLRHGGIDPHSTAHSTSSRAQHSRTQHSRTRWHGTDPTHHHGRSYATGSTAQHSHTVHTVKSGRTAFVYTQGRSWSWF
jgi:hypothetical protein